MPYSLGVILMTTWPYWPRPPVWRTKRASALRTGLGDALAVGHLRPADVGVHFELAQQAVDDDLQMELAHAGDDGLARLLVGAHAEGRVFVGQLHEALAQPVLVDLGLGLDGHEDDRLGELDGLEDDRAAPRRRGCCPWS